MRRNFDISPLLFKPTNAIQLGLVASSKRILKDGLEYDRYFPVAKATKTFLKYGTKVSDITDELKRIVKETLWQTKQIAPLFKRSSVYETAKAIDRFIREHIQYEEEDQEQLREPARTWYDRKGDCDCFTIFISSILSNLKIPHELRLAEYQNKGYYQHIYVILKDESGRLIVIDCVKDRFNDEHIYSNKHDLSMLEIYQLSGLNTNFNSNQMEAIIPDYVIQTVRANRLSGDEPATQPGGTTDKPVTTSTNEESGMTGFMNKAKAFIQKYWIAIALAAVVALYMFKKKGKGLLGLSGTSGKKETGGERNKPTNWKQKYQEKVEKEQKAKQKAEFQKKLDAKNRTIANLRNDAKTPAKKK